MKIYRIIKNFVYALLGKKTIGARALVIDNDKILLVEHTYMQGWCTIGGGIEKGETPQQAILRELLEEVGIVAKSVKLFSVYHSQAEKRDDYVVFYICTDFIEKNNISVSEIREKKWFKLKELPSDITPATLRRIKEYCGEIEISDKW